MCGKFFFSFFFLILFFTISLSVFSRSLSLSLRLVLLAFRSISTGIFAYLNHMKPKTRQEILEYLIKGLQRLEYRGYDSAGKTSLTDGAFTVLKLMNFRWSNFAGQVWRSTVSIRTFPSSVDPARWRCWKMKFGRVKTCNWSKVSMRMSASRTLAGQRTAFRRPSIRIRSAVTISSSSWSFTMESSPTTRTSKSCWSVFFGQGDLWL